MSRQKKKNRNVERGEAAGTSRFPRLQDDSQSDAYRPFADLRIKQRAVEKEATGGDASSSRGDSHVGGSAPTEKAKASSKTLSRKSVVGGFDPSADFGDILRQWEATGDPYAMPGKGAGGGPVVGRRLKKRSESDNAVKRMDDTTQAARKSVQSMDFARIFAQWEAGGLGDGTKKPSGGKASAQGSVPSGQTAKSRIVSSGPRKDFAQILEEWEASQLPKQASARKVSRAASPATAEPAEFPVEPSDHEEEEPVDDGRPRPVWSAGKPTRFGSDRISGGGGFADIYDQWAAQQQHEEEARLEQAVIEKESEAVSAMPLELSKLRQMLPQVTLDLHGLTADEAATRVRNFLSDSHRNHLRKVCVIHGKGLHAPQGQGVLKDIVLQEIERSKVVREFSVPPARYGGSGVLWLILKD